MIDLFRPLMNWKAADMVADTLSYKEGKCYIGEGPRVAEFEQRFARMVGVNKVLATNSGTSAIDLALHLCDVGPDDEVITTPMTCSATNGQIITRGAIPIWADVDPYTGLIEPNDVARKITRGTKAIIGVDWGGKLCDYRALKKFGVPVIQDAAHSLLAGIGGDYVCWSFQAIKHLTTGDGGALYTKQYDRARLLRWYGLDRTKGESFRCSQNISEAGYKYHMNDIAATIGLANLECSRWAVNQHRRNAEFYGDQLGHDRPEPDSNSSWWLYTMLIENREGFIQHLADRDIVSSPVHTRNDKHTGFSAPAQHLPGVDYFSSRNVAIPVGWWLTEEDRKQIVEAVNTW